MPLSDINFDGLIKARNEIRSAVSHRQAEKFVGYIGRAFDWCLSEKASEASGCRNLWPSSLPGAVADDTGQRRPGGGSEPRYHLTLRDGEAGVKPLLEAEGSLDDLVDQAAVAVLGAIDPLSAADYLRGKWAKGQIVALSMANEGLRRARLHDGTFWFQLLKGIPHLHARAEVPVVMLARASALSALGRIREALETFDAAGHEFQNNDDARANDYAADGRGFAILQRAERGEASRSFALDLDEAQRILWAPVQDNYDSAVYHLAEVRRVKFERDLVDSGCGARSVADFLSAQVAYDRPFLEDLAPTFARKSRGCSMSGVDWLAEGVEGTKLAYIASSLGLFFDPHCAANDVLAGIEILGRPLPRSGRTALSAVLEDARRVTWHIAAAGAPYSMKDRLKDRSYKWDSGERVWWKEVADGQAGRECAWLKAWVLPSRAQVEPVRVTAAERYSRRAIRGPLSAMLRASMGRTAASARQVQSFLSTVPAA